MDYENSNNRRLLTLTMPSPMLLFRLRSTRSVFSFAGESGAILVSCGGGECVCRAFVVLYFIYYSLSSSLSAPIHDIKIDH